MVTAITVVVAGAGTAIAASETRGDHPLASVSVPEAAGRVANSVHLIDLDTTAANSTVSVPDPGTADPHDTVQVIDPSLVDPHVDADNAQAAVDAQAAAANVLSPADYKKAQEALVAMLADAPPSTGADSTTSTTNATDAGAPAARDLANITLASTHTVRITIYKWELEAMAWYYIVAGGTIAVVGGFFDFTGVGIPVGAILNAIGIGTGIGGSALLWWVDAHFPDHRTYVIRW